MLRLAVAVSLLFGLPAAATPAPASPPPPRKVAMLSLPPDSGIDEANLDRSADPCGDFYQFACGGWLKRTEIPADRPLWLSFTEIEERNLTTARSLLEKDASGAGDKGADPFADKVGAFYSACMDEPRI